MNPLGLETLAGLGLDPASFVRLAGELGCSHATLNLGPAANRLPDMPEAVIRTDPAVRRAVRAACEETGVRIGVLEGFAITRHNCAGDLEADLDIAAGIGATAICTVSLEKDIARTHDEFARLTEMAANRGLITTTEVGAGVLRTLAASVAAVAAVGSPSFRLLIDTMHFFRSGSTVADMAALDPACIGHIQLADVPMPAVIESYMEEALYERRCPGDGDLPLRDFLRHVPPEVVVGLEIPIRSEALAGVGPRERIGRCVAAARELMAR